MLIEKAFRIWNLKDIQQAIVINDWLQSQGLSFEDLRQKIKTRQSISIPLLSCPICGKKMNLYPVNNSAESQVGEGYQSMWLCGTSCSGKGCWYEEYNKKSVVEILAKLANGGK